MSDSELLSIFWVEVSEYLTTLNNGLLEVEMAEGDQRKNLLHEMNRVAHSMKGAARAVGISVIETMGHYMEEVFHAAKEGALELAPEDADTLYDALDLIKNVMDGEDNDPDLLTNVVASLELLVASIGVSDDKSNDSPAHQVNGSPRETSTNVTVQQPSQETPVVTVSRPSPSAKITSTSSQETADVSSPTILMRPAEETIRVTVGKLDRLMAEASELLVAKMQGEDRHSKIISLRQTHSRWLREWRNVRTAYIRLVRYMQDRDEEINSELNTLFRFLESNQRYLTDTRRELTQLGQNIAQDNMQLGTLADQLQSDIATMRMMPFETVIGGFQRMVRDLSRDLGKQLHLNIIGANVEIDKTVLDSLNDPLMHLLRNSIDHGIESPAEREAAGKPPTGHIMISIEQRGSEIVMRIADDGRGIDVDRIREKAIQNHILAEQDSESISDDELRQFIFHPGFSTRSNVTSVSGRGLGMDIVRTRVENLRGQVYVASERGQGTSITLRMPVSLTRIRCILLRLADENYAIPSVMVTRMLTINRSDIFTAEGKDMVDINGDPTPLVSLGSILGVASARDPESEKIAVLGLRSGERSVAFEVDRLMSEIEVVLKPLGTELQHAPFIAGAALMGTGRVIVVLDANDLTRRASGIMLPQRTILRQATKADVAPRLRVLVADDSITTRTLEKNILETAGFIVHVAVDGAEAWAMLEDIEVDVVISDVEMPNMTGLQLAAHIKGSPKTQHLPVILLTSLAKPEQREAGLRAGADAYLVKSQFDQEQLLEAIQSVI